MLVFPLYKNDGIPSIKLNDLQKRSLAEFTAKLNNGTYHLVDNPCLCGGHDDICVTEKDRYGIPCRYVLCRRCGVVRQEKRLDDESTALFYRDDYRNIYVGKEQASASFFADQVRHGGEFYSITEKYTDIARIKTVFEAGCGAGGILYAFHRQGKNVSGCDFGDKYLEYGRSKGLNLYNGEPDLTKTAPNSQDLVILSHVLEHLNNPAEYVNTLAEIVSPGGYLLIQLPGLLSMHRQYAKPIIYFQNAHVNNFYGHFLTRFFEALGLEVVYGDEWCTFLLRKPENWVKRNTDGLKIWDDSMPEWSRKIQRALKRYYVYSRLRGYYFLHPLHTVKRIPVKILELLGIKDKVKKLIGRE